MTSLARDRLIQEKKEHGESGKKAGEHSTEQNTRKGLAVEFVSTREYAREKGSSPEYRV